VAKNFAIHGESDAEVGSDFIKGGDGGDLIGGEALAVAKDGVAAAVSVNKADGAGHHNKGGDAGNDTIIGDGGEGYGNDSVGGDAAAMGQFAVAKAYNDADDENSDAGNDKIVTSKGDDVVAGDALAISGGWWGLAKAHNTADDEGQAGNDDIDLGSGNNTFSGDALSLETAELPENPELPDEIEEEVEASAYAFNTADEGGEAGNDTIVAGWGDDIGAGDAAEISYYGTAHAHTENDADGWGSDAGNDTIFTDGGDDTVSGGSLAKGKYGALAVTENDADDKGEAGNDKIVADSFGGWGDDQVAGDAMAVAVFGDAEAKSDNYADDDGEAGNDTVWAANGNNVVAGDAMAESKFDDAEAYADNTAKDKGSAGDDEIVTGHGEDIVSGDAQAIAWDEATADADNKATGYDASAGNDDINVDGGWWNCSVGRNFASGGMVTSPPHKISVTRSSSKTHRGSPPSAA
jgi:hypothetical protein